MRLLIISGDRQNVNLIKSYLSQFSDFAIDYTETDNQNATFDTATGSLRPFIEFPVSEQGRLQLRYTLDYGLIMGNPGAQTILQANGASVWSATAVN